MSEAHPLGDFELGNYTIKKYNEALNNLKRAENSSNILGVYSSIDSMLNSLEQSKPRKGEIEYIRWSQSIIKAYRQTSGIIRNTFSESRLEGLTIERKELNEKLTSTEEKLEELEKDKEKLKNERTRTLENFEGENIYEKISNALEYIGDINLVLDAHDIETPEELRGYLEVLKQYKIQDTDELGAWLSDSEIFEGVREEIEDARNKLK